MYLWIVLSWEGKVYFLKRVSRKTSCKKNCIFDADVFITALLSSDRVKVGCLLFTLWCHSIAKKHVLVTASHSRSQERHFKVEIHYSRVNVAASMQIVLISPKLLWKNSHSHIMSRITGAWNVYRDLQGVGIICWSWFWSCQDEHLLLLA